MLSRNGVQSYSRILNGEDAQRSPCGSALTNHGGNHRCPSIHSFEPFVDPRINTFIQETTSATDDDQRSTSTSMPTSPSQPLMTVPHCATAGRPPPSPARYSSVHSPCCYVVLVYATVSSLFRWYHFFSTCMRFSSYVTVYILLVGVAAVNQK